MGIFCRGIRCEVEWYERIVYTVDHVKVVSLVTDSICELLNLKLHYIQYLHAITLTNE
jgi:hypothetical protein